MLLNTGSYLLLNLSRLFSIWALFFLVACTSREEAAITYNGIFTSVNIEDCRELDPAEIEQHALYRLGQVVFQCPGPAQYSIFMIDDGTIGLHSTEVHASC